MTTLFIAYHLESWSYNTVGASAAVVVIIALIMCIMILLQYVESIQSGAECILAVSSESRLIVFFYGKYSNF